MFGIVVSYCTQFILIREKWVMDGTKKEKKWGASPLIPLTSVANRAKIIV